MPALLIVLAIVVTVAAAMRSTWSPCGWSMLSTITPVGESGRGRSYPVTAAWFIAGAVAGGGLLGGLMAGLARAAAASRMSTGSAVAVGGLAALVGAASDARVGGFSLPIHRRQVNEDWLDLYRPWVYGAGFGFQIGFGFATYITTAAVYLVVVFGALTRHPLVAVALGLGFGTLRGLAVLLGRRLDSPDAMRAFHRRFEVAGTVSRRVTVVAQIGVGLAAATAALPFPVVVAAYAFVCATALFSLQRESWASLRGRSGRAAQAHRVTAPDRVG